MSRPLGAKVHYNHNHTNHMMMMSRGQCDTTTATTTTRSSWYDDDDADKNDDLSSSSYSLSKENLTVPCWGGWLLKLTTLRSKQPQLQPRDFTTTMRKSSINAIVSSSSTTSDDSEIGHDDDDDEDEEDHESSSYNSRCRTPPCPPMVTFPNTYGSRGKLEENEEELSDEMRLIRSLEVEGDRFELEGFLLEALSVYQRLLELHRATGQSADRIGKVHYRTGMIQYKRNYYNEALCHFDQALFIYQLNYNPDEDYHDDDDDDDDTAANDIALDFYRVYVATGHVHLSNHNPYRAIDYFHRALQFVKPEPNPLKQSKRRDTYDTYYTQVLQALGTAYETVGDDTEAQLHYQKAAATGASTTNRLLLQPDE